MARVSSEGASEAAGDSAKALQQLRLKGFVKADPNLAMELTDLCESSLGLPKVADRLRCELKAHEMAASRANSGSPRSSRTGTASTTASSRPRSKTGPAGGAAARSQQGSSAGFSEPSSRRRRGNRQEEQGGLRASASAPNMRKTERLAPLARKNTRPDKAALVDEKSSVDPESRAASKTERDASKEALPTCSKGRLAAAAWDETRQAYFKSAADVVKLGTKAPPPAEGDEAQEEPAAPVMMQTTFNLLPMGSKQGLATKARELRRQIAGDAMRKACEDLKAKGSELLDLPTALVRVIGIKREKFKVRQELEGAMNDFCSVQVLENREETSSDSCVWDVHIQDDMSVVGALLRIKDKVKGVQYRIEIVWPLERVQAELGIAFPEYEISTTDLNLLIPAVEESYRLYADSWVELQSDKKAIEAADILGKRDSVSRRAGRLVLPNVGAAKHLIEDEMKQSAKNLENLMADAEWAHLRLKEALAPESPWASAKMNDFDEVPETHESRTWRPEEEGAFKGAWLYDPGLMPASYAELKARLRHEVYETDVSWEEVGGISRLEVVFDNFKQMSSVIDYFLEDFEAIPAMKKKEAMEKKKARDDELEAMREEIERLRKEVEVEKGEGEKSEDDETLKELEEQIKELEEQIKQMEEAEAKEDKVDKKSNEEMKVMWVDNRVLRPSCIGVKEVLIGVRISEEREDGSQRFHICEVRVSHQYMNYCRHGDAGERWASIQNVLEACGVQRPDMEVVCDILLNVLDCTSPRLIRRMVVDFDRMVKYAKALLVELDDVFKPIDVESCNDLIAEATSQAKTAGMDRTFIDRMLRRFEIGAMAEHGEWHKAEADREARLLAEKNAAEERERKQKEDEERAAREEAEAAEAAEFEATRTLKEAKAKKAAENEAKKAAKEADVSAKAAEREAEKKREAELQANAAATAEAFLASKGLDSVHAISECGKPALLHACLEDAITLESVLMQGPDIRASSSEDGSGAMHAAAGAGSVANLEVLLRYGLQIEQQTETGERPIHSAAGAGSVEAMEWLKQKGAKVNAKSMAGRSPIFEAAAKDKVEAVEWLVENGASLDIRDDTGTMLLHVAALHNAHKMVKWLIEKGADSSAKDGEGQSAKQIAKKNKCKKALDAMEPPE